MKVSVRPAEVGDAAAIAQVHVRSWRGTYAGIVPETYLASLDEEEWTQSWRDRLTMAMTTLVVEDEAGVFGFASGGRSREEGSDEEGSRDEAEIYAIYLIETRQGQGVGRLLFGTLAARLAAQGYTSLRVWVLEQNPAVAFYERLGGIAMERKLIAIGGVELTETAFGWRELRGLLAGDDRLTR